MLMTLNAFEHAMLRISFHITPVIYHSALPDDKSYGSDE